MKPPQKKVLFKVIGGWRIGIGHVMRSVELAKEIKKNLDWDVSFVCNPDENCVSLIEQEGIDVVFSGGDSKKLVDIAARCGVDIVIFDQLEEFKSLSMLLKRKLNTFIVVLDYFNYENKNVDLIINLFNHNPHFDPKGMEGYYEGVEYAIIRGSFKEYITKKKVIEEQVQKITITFGGSDTNSNTLKVLDLLEQMTGNFEINVVLGPLFKDENKIKKYDCIIHRNISDIVELMFNADLGFSGAGTTMMEFCALGTPLVVLPQTEKETRFARFFKQKNAVELLDTSLTESEKADLVSKIIENKKMRENLSKNQKPLIDGKGKERIKKLIIENYEKDNVHRGRAFPA